MKIKHLIMSVLAMGSMAAQAQKTPVWCNPAVNEINRKMDAANFFAYESMELAEKSQAPQDR